MTKYKYISKLITIIICLLILFIITVFSLPDKNKVNDTIMQEVYEEIKTPYKYGLVLVPQDSTLKMDCPTVFKKGTA